MTKFHVGLDLGQASDYTAVAVIEVAGEALHVRHLERFRHTLYPDVADRVEALLDSPQLKGASKLVIDATGVGPAVTDIFTKRGRSFKAVKIHGGDAESRQEPPREHLQGAQEEPCLRPASGPADQRAQDRLFAGACRGPPPGAP